MRVASRDYEYNGTIIEKGMTVMTSIYALHHDEDHFPEPHKYIPERFLPENFAKLPSMAYIPFGEGPKICLGMRFGQMQARIGLATMLHHFRFKLSPKTPVPLKLTTIGLVLQSKEGFHFIVEEAD